MFFTELYNRKLFFDGDSVYNPEDVLKLPSKHNVKYVDYLTPSIIEYNKYTVPTKQIKIKQDCDNWDLSWNIPDEYKELNVVDYVFDKHIGMTDGMTDEEINERDCRLITELNLYTTTNKTSILRTIIYIIDTLNQHDIVYGVGRGSSVSSYVLYVIGAHDIDSFAFGLDIEDFFHK